MARSIARQRELAIRVALGASRSRMAGEALTEGLLLSLGGGVAGCFLAYGLLRLFILLAPEGIPPLSLASLDLRVLSFRIGRVAALRRGLRTGARFLHAKGRDARREPHHTIGGPAGAPAAGGRADRGLAGAGDLRRDFPAELVEPAGGFAGPAHGAGRDGAVRTRPAVRAAGREGSLLRTARSQAGAAARRGIGGAERLAASGRDAALAADLCSGSGRQGTLR